MKLNILSPKNFGIIIWIIKIIPEEDPCTCSIELGALGSWVVDSESDWDSLIIIIKIVLIITLKKFFSLLSYHMHASNACNNI